MPNLKGRSLLTLLDFSKTEIEYLLKLSRKVKIQSRNHIVKSRFKGKTLAMIFEKRSTRTRCAFETGFAEESGHPVFLSMDDIQLGAKESIEDTAKVLGRMFSAIIFRGFKQETVEKLAEYSGIPVFNGLTDSFHPTQALADIMTIDELLGRKANLKICYIGDGRNNVANSLMVITSILGINFTIISPESLFPEKQLVERTESNRKKSGSNFFISPDIKDIKNSDVLYTDTWVSMGEEKKSAQRIKILKPYQITKKMLYSTGNPDTIFMHCLPAVKGNEITEEAFNDPKSKVFEQAENRKHTIKAVMLAALT